MADAVLLLKGNDPRYASIDGDAGMRASRSIQAGLSESSNHFIKLGEHENFDRSEKPLSGLSLALASLGESEISLIPNEKLCFGKKDGAVAYSKPYDLCLSECPSMLGVKAALRELEDEEIVMTLWPSSKKACPARVHRAGKRVWLDLAEEQDKEGRCFVFDEGWNELVAVSQPIIEGQAPTVSHCGVGSWLCATGSKAASWSSGRFEIEPDGDAFIVKDSKTGRGYRGKFKTEGPESQRMEMVFLERRLASKGIGGLIPSYKLAKEKQ